MQRLVAARSALLRRRVEVIFRILPALICFIFPVSSCASSSDESCIFEHSIRSGAIGPVQLGLSLDELYKEYSVAVSNLPYSDISGYAVTFCDHEATVLVETNTVGVVISLSTSSTSFQTDPGAKVGMNLVRLQALHPEGVISTGVEEGGWIAFRLEEISGFFEFSLDGIEFSCLQDYQTCMPEFYERPAIRYWTR
jgi:hypothetical protein